MHAGRSEGAFRRLIVLRVAVATACICPVVIAHACRTTAAPPQTTSGDTTSHDRQVDGGDGDRGRQHRRIQRSVIKRHRPPPLILAERIRRARSSASATKRHGPTVIRHCRWTASPGTVSQQAPDRPPPGIEKRRGVIRRDGSPSIRPSMGRITPQGPAGSKVTESADTAIDRSPAVSQFEMPLLMGVSCRSHEPLEYSRMVRV